MARIHHAVFSGGSPHLVTPKRGTDRLRRGTRKFELWCSIARWIKRQYPALDGLEFFIEKPAKSQSAASHDRALLIVPDRRSMMVRLIEYMTWRATISKETDPVTGWPIINPKTRTAKAISAYSVMVLAMELDDLVSLNSTSIADNGRCSSKSTLTGPKWPRSRERFKM